MKKLFRLTHAERWLLFQAACGVVAARVMLLAMPLATVRRAVWRMLGAEARLPVVRRCSAERVAWAVGVAAKRSPCGSTCLATALVGQALMWRHGHDARLRIGVRRDRNTEFGAHAWLEREGRIVVGGPRSVVDRYEPFPELEHLIQ